MKKLILRGYKIISMPLWRALARVSSRIAYFMHYQLFLSEWSVDNPEYFNHDIDLYCLWEKERRAYWLERGIYNILALQIFAHPVVVELCCGEGFNTKYFYSKVADRVWACDFDKKAIHSAKRKYAEDNIEFEVADIRQDIPKELEWGETITNVIWDAAIEHFTPDEIRAIMSKIKLTLSTKKGILSGYTIVEREKKSLEQHEHEFKNKDDLKRFLTPYFENVVVFETIYDDRHNLYFWASDGDIPFSKSWRHWTKQENGVEVRSL